MKTPRERFEDDYVAVEVPCKNKKGVKIRYEYYGPWYVWDVDSHTLKRRKYLIGAACAMCVLLFFASALQDTTLNYSPLVEIPGLFSIAVLLFEVIGVVQFCVTKTKMTRSSYQDINMKMRISTLAHAVLLLITTLASVYLIILQKLSLYEVAISAGYFFSGVCSAIIYYKYQSLQFITQKNDFPQNAVQ